MVIKLDYKKSNGKVKLIFVYQVDSFWVSWNSLYQSCLADNRFEVKVLWINGNEGDKAQMEHAEDFLKEKKIQYEPFSYERVMQFAPDYMIYQTPYDKGHRPVDTWTARYRRMGIRIVYIPYGIEISDTLESRYKHFCLSVILNAHLIFVLSEAMKKEYEKYCINAKAVRVLGLPRFDDLKNRTYHLPEAVMQKAAGRKIVLWKCHFPKIFIEEGIKKQATPDLDEYMKFTEYIKTHRDLFYIFMPHPKFTDDTVDPELQREAKQMVIELERLDNVYVDRNSDYRNSLMNADAIITDRSAVMVEAGAGGVPVLYMYNHYYSEPMTPPVKKLLDSYYQGTTAMEMIRFCNMVNSGKDGRAEIRHSAFAQCVPFYDGKCAQRIKEEIWEDAHRQEPNMIIDQMGAGTKLVVFGTGDISCMCMELLKQKKDKNFEIIAFIDNNKEKQGTLFYQKPVIAAEQLLDVRYNYAVIASDKYFTEIYKQLTEEMNIEKAKIMTYDQFVTWMLT